MKTDIIARSNAAKTVLNSNAFHLLVDEVKLEIFQQWSRTNASDTEVREQLHSVMLGLDNLLVKAEKYANEGKFEEQRDVLIPQE